MRPLLATALVLLVAAPAVARDSKIPEAVPDGKPVSCLSESDVDHTSVRSDSIIDFYTRDGKVYRNTLPSSCPQLGFEQRYLHESPIDQICSVDTITVLTEPGLSRGATCGLGQFQPVKLVKAAK